MDGHCVVLYRAVILRWYSSLVGDYSRSHIRTDKEWSPRYQFSSPNDKTVRVTENPQRSAGQRQIAVSSASDA